MRSCTRDFLLLSLLASASAASAETIAIIGTGDTGNSLSPKLAGIGYRIVYGSRDPSRDYVQELLSRTAPNAIATNQKDAAQSADIVLLAAPWPAMKQVAQNLGNLDGKIVIDVSFPIDQGPDGYPQNLVETSSSEMIQAWNPGAPLKECSEYPPDPQKLNDD